MRNFKKKLSGLLMFLFLFTLLPTLRISAEVRAIQVDGYKDILWETMAPLATSDEVGFNDFDLGNFYLTSDEEFLYFYVDAVKVPDWGDNGQFINIALHVKGREAQEDGVPWGGQFNFQGTEEKPNYHLVMRVKGTQQVNGAALYATEDLSTPLLTSWGNPLNAAFGVHVDHGFEGKIPLAIMDLKPGDEVSGLVVLSGNDGENHGAFDVVPRAAGNTIATSWHESGNVNVQSVYSKGYVIPKEAPLAIQVDGQKDELWAQMKPLATSEAAGFQGFDLGNLYLTSDDEFLYYYVDAINVPDWGNDGQFINIALNVKDEASEEAGVPWGGQFNFQGTDEKPNYHIVMRVKGKQEINGAALYAVNDLTTPLLASWDNLQGAEFGIDLAHGFEGKIPLSILNLTKGQEISAIAVLSGNDGGNHGAFDVVPRAIGNTIATSWHESGNVNVQSFYSNSYTIGSQSETLQGLKSLQGGSYVLLGEMVQFQGVLAGEEGAVLPSSELIFRVTTEAGEETTMATIDASGKLQAVELPFGAFARKVKVSATRKSDETQVVSKVVTIARSHTPKVQEDGVIFYAEYEGETLNLMGSLNHWDNKGIAMSKNAQGIFQVKVPLAAGVYEYKFFPVSGSWDDGFKDPYNQKEAAGNSVVIVPGIYITTASELQIGQETTLHTTYLNKEGEEVAATPIYTLKEEVPGVSVEGEVLKVHSEAKENDTVTVLATYGTYESEKTFTLVETMYTYTIYYYRYDGKVQDWALWIWEDGKEGQKIDFLETTEKGFGKAVYKTTVESIHVIPRTKGDWSQQEPTKVIQIQENETVDAWILQDVEKVFYKEEDVDISARVRSAMMDAVDTVYVRTSAEITDEELATFQMVDKDGEVVETLVSRLSDSAVQLTLVEEIDVRETYRVESAGFIGAPVTMRKVLDDARFYYGGADLGLTYTKERSVFKVWAPTAKKVSLMLYEDMGVYNEQGVVTSHVDGQEVVMNRLDQGVWTTGVSEDLEGQYYMYQVTFADGKVHYAVDPYATAVSPNGQRTAVVDLRKTIPEGFKSAKKPVVAEPTDAVLYELHVRDFSIDESSGISEELKGKFLAFTEEGTTLPGNDKIKTGVDHLKELGITHVHLLPSYDYKTVNELSLEPQFNWGYDPQNYNVPEGSYATNVLDPGRRIKEFKAMVEALHEAGIGVVMDVVYNHTYESLTSSFDLVVPGYYYRTSDDGRYLNGSGTGNEVATERPMVRKYIKDSVRYWAEEYHVDGFRFDLMGLIDVTTMTELTEELRSQVDPNILLYGEPWDAGTNGLPSGEQTKKGSQRDLGFAVFNDHFRGAIKGDSDGEGQGFASGATGQEEAILRGVKGAVEEFSNGPSEVINYVTAHDNLNLWDKFIYTQGLKDEVGFLRMLDGRLVEGGSVEEAVAAADPYKFIEDGKVLDNETVKRTLLANGIVFTSQGVPFFQAGDEFLRTKFGDHNSYKSPDAINKIRWDNKETFKPVFDYYQGLIALRQSHPAFRMSTKQALESHLVVLRQSGNVVTYMLKDHANGDSWKNIVVIYNGNKEAQMVDLPKDGTWQVAVDHEKASAESFRSIAGGQVKVEGLSMMVLYDEALESYEQVATRVEPSKFFLGLEPKQSLFITAKVYDQKDRLMEKAHLTFSSSDESILLVNAEGKLTALKEGQVLVRVQSGEAAAQVEVTVGKLVPTVIQVTGDTLLYTSRTLTLQAMVWDQYNQRMLKETVTFASSNEEVATVNAQGVVTGVREGSVIITAKAGDVIAEHTITVKPYVRRFVHIKYLRPEKDYEGWNMWVWNTGVKNDQIDFTEIREDGAYGIIEIAPETKSIGFLFRKGTDWAEKDAYGDDRYIETDLDQTVIKVTVTSGVKDFFTVPKVSKPEINDGVVVFQYRDEERFAKNEMHLLKRVQLKVGDTLYDMTYEEKNERFSHTLILEKEGVYEYTYLVTDEAGKTIELTDPKNTVDGKSFIEYVKPKMDVQVAFSKPAIAHHENTVISFVLQGEEEELRAREIRMDLSALGGPKTVLVDPELMAHSLSVRDHISAGDKVIPVEIVDVYGNGYAVDVVLTVKTRQYVGQEDFDFDEARIYFVLTDRFHNGDPSNDDPHGIGYDSNHLETYHGGDLKGLTMKLDYLKDLGINTLWMTPIVDNIDFNMAATWGGNLPESQKQQYGYHGYWAKDFEKLDEHLGTLADLHELIDEAHARGIKIMLDVVVNHAGYGMRSSDENIHNLPHYPTEEERTKFDGLFREPGLQDDVRGDLAGLPDFRTEDPAVRETIIKWQTDWLERAKTAKGNTIDYFRIDTVNNVESTTLKALKNALTEIDPTFKVIGEAYGASINNDRGQLRSGQMDAILDFSFKYSVLNFLRGGIDGVEEYLREVNDRIDNTATLGLFLGSHDEDGFLERVEGTELEKLAMLKAASALQLTAKGQPVIYYGEELGMSGKAAQNMDQGDGNFGENRYDMPWDRLEEEPYRAVHSHYRTLLAIRSDYSKVFAKGSREVVGGGDEAKYTVFKRAYGDDEVIVAINASTEEKAVEIQTTYEAGTMLVDLYNDVTYEVQENQHVLFSLPSMKDGATVILVEKTVTPENPEEPKEPETPEEPKEPETPEEPEVPAVPETPEEPKDDNEYLKNDTEKILSAMEESEENAVIVIDATEQTKVSKEVFQGLKGQNKTLVFVTEQAIWTFHGKDITEVKDIDLQVTMGTILTSKSKNKEAIKNLVQGADVLILAFASNGILPGKATVRNKVDPVWLLGKNAQKLFVYYYNEESGKAEVVAEKLEVDAQGYITLTLSHNSDYFISDQDLMEKGVLPKTGETPSNAMMPMGIALSILGFMVLYHEKRKQSLLKK